MHNAKYWVRLAADTLFTGFVWIVLIAVLDGMEFLMGGNFTFEWWLTATCLNSIFATGIASCAWTILRQ